MRRLSIICVALNEEARIPCWKAAVDELVVPAGWSVETVLIDGGSTEGTVEAAREARVDRVEELAGASIPRCRNRGAGLATGDVLAYLDADCEPASDWLVQSVHWFAGEAPTLVGWPAAPPDPPTWVQRAWHTHWLAKNPAWIELKGRRVVLHQAFRLLTTRNLLLNRQAFQALGGFDESLVTGEDTDLAFRAHHLGLRVVADPALRVTHHGDPATLGVLSPTALARQPRQLPDPPPPGRGRQRPAIHDRLPGLRAPRRSCHPRRDRPRRRLAASGCRAAGHPPVRSGDLPGPARKRAAVGPRPGGAVCGLRSGPDHRHPGRAPAQAKLEITGFPAFHGEQGMTPDRLRPVTRCPDVGIPPDCPLNSRPGPVPAANRPIRGQSCPRPAAGPPSASGRPDDARPSGSPAAPAATVPVRAGGGPLETPRDHGAVGDVVVGVIGSLGIAIIHKDICNLSFHGSNKPQGS